MLKQETRLIKNKVVYEQPLTEQMRSFMRLAYLFEGVDYYSKSPSSWDSRSAVNGLIEIVEVMARVNCKVEAIKYLEHYASLLVRWQKLPDVDDVRLAAFTDKIDYLVDTLKSIEGEVVRPLNQHYLLNSVAQRKNIPGGMGAFDLPAYHHWLHKKPIQRQQDLLDWLQPLQPLYESIEVILYLLRNNVAPEQKVAYEGFYQSKLGNETDCQMIRVILPNDYWCYPEISGGKQRFTIRFYEQGSENQIAMPVQQDVQFELCCCMI